MYSQSTFLILLCALVYVQGVRLKHNENEQQSRIKDGMKVDIMQYPYTAYVESSSDNGRRRCGGAIISNTSILTAASCLYGAKLAMVRIGSNFRTSGGQTYMSTTFRLYPGYNSTNTRFNAAIILIPEEMQLDGEKTATIPVANMGGPDPREFVTVTGWGARNSGEDGSVSLYAAKVMVLSNTVCQTNPQYTNVNFCTSGDKMDVCQGDEGDPAVKDSMLFGITAAPVCGSNSTSLFAKANDLRIRIFIRSTAGV